MTSWLGAFVVLALSGVTLGGCADGYGYSGVGVGIGSPGYYGGSYYDSYYGGPGLGGYYGWYGDYYYPGTGYYVYDRDRRPFRWNDAQRGYWEGRRRGWQGRGDVRANWDGFVRDGRPGRGGWQEGRRDWRSDRAGVGGLRPRGDGDRGRWSDRAGVDNGRSRGDRGHWGDGRRADAGRVDGGMQPDRAPRREGFAAGAPGRERFGGGPPGGREAFGAGRIERQPGGGGGPRQGGRGRPR